MLLCHRHVLPYVVLSSLSLGACVMSNPGWDPPVADGQTETGRGEEGWETDEGWESGQDTSSDDDGMIPIDDDDDQSTGGDGDGDGDGDGEGDGDGDGEGDGDGDNLVCGHASASWGPCPAICDECHDGVCWRFCGEGECDHDFMLCPVAWACHVVCLGKDSCRDTTVACTGWGECEVECQGNNACAEADIMCAGGPCNVTCGAGFDKPCENLDVQCGSNVTELRCKEPYDGAGPELTHQEFAQCECSSNCVPDKD